MFKKETAKLKPFIDTAQLLLCNGVKVNGYTIVVDVLLRCCPDKSKERKLFKKCCQFVMMERLIVSPSKTHKNICKKQTVGHIKLVFLLGHELRQLRYNSTTCR